MFTVLEKSTHAHLSAQPGLLPPCTTTPLTLFFTSLLTLLLLPKLGPLAPFPAFAFARLISLELTAFTLPNVYVWPLVLVGLLHTYVHFLHTHAQLAITFLAVFGALSHTPPKRLGVGGGDLKLLAAYICFFPLHQSLIALGLACLAYLPIAFFTPRHPIPLGLPIIMAWVWLWLA